MLLYLLYLFLRDFLRSFTIFAIAKMPVAFKALKKCGYHLANDTNFNLSTKQILVRCLRATYTAILLRVSSSQR